MVLDSGKAPPCGRGVHKPFQHNTAILVVSIESTSNWCIAVVNFLLFVCLTVAVRVCSNVIIVLSPRPHQQQRRSNIVECYNSNDSFDKVECCFDKGTLLRHCCWCGLGFMKELKRWLTDVLWRCCMDDWPEWYPASRILLQLFPKILLGDFCPTWANSGKEGCVK